ncbi:ARPP-2 domain-containing protein [Stackebrandtia soli]|uniref:ARPP-2 domain-containing protein n=1 Tax=Stackebrandtia soli TaxID=1892856 RepID=UPI0039ECD718
MRLDLTGLTVGPSQEWGNIRLVPLLRDRPIEGLRLDARLYDDDMTIVDLDGRTSYLSYIPHGFVATWGEDEVGAAYGTQLRGSKRPAVPHSRIAVKKRMARRVATNRLRFLPLHLAIEGYLSLHFGGPTIAWESWSQQAIRRGLSPRVEQAYSGGQVSGLSDALRVFEILSDQCGVIVYVADAFASAFVTPDARDYRALHPTLVRDLYGELVWQYGLVARPVPPVPVGWDDAYVDDLNDIRRNVTRLEREWESFHNDSMAVELLRSNEFSAERIYKLGTFTLSRFTPSFARDTQSHVGEYITDHKGRIAYLKTFKLSTAQARRGWTLNQLADADWDLDRAAEAAGTSTSDMVNRLDRLGYGFLVREDLLHRFRGRRRAS